MQDRQEEDVSSAGERSGSGSAAEGSGDGRGGSTNSSDKDSGSALAPPGTDSDVDSIVSFGDNDGPDGPCGRGPGRRGGAGVEQGGQGPREPPPQVHVPGVAGDGEAQEDPSSRHGRGENEIEINGRWFTMLMKHGGVGRAQPGVPALPRGRRLPRTQKLPLGLSLRGTSRPRVGLRVAGTFAVGGGGLSI